MPKLLRADFRRLFRSKLFWLALSVAVGFAALATVMRVYEGNVLQEPGYGTPDGLLFLGATYLGVAVAVFSSLFIGTEHAGGTWRNKLITGQGKVQVYLSCLIVSSVATLLMHLAYIAVVLGFAVPLLSPFRTPIQLNVTFFFCSLFAAVALNALMMLFCMLIHHRAAVVVVCMLLALALMMGGMAIQQALSEPEYFLYPGVTTVDGVVISGPQTHPNAGYVTGAKRAVYQFLQDFLPSGQMSTIAMSNELPAQVWKLPIYSVLFTLLVTLGGAWGFCRRDLK